MPRPSSSTSAPPSSFTVSRGEQGTPLLQLLRKRLGISGKKAKAHLDRREVFVNEARVWIAKHPCRAGDTIRIGAATPERPARLHTLYTDEHLVAVDKPPGIVSDRDPDSVEALLRRQLDRPGLRALHRLDRDTSGVLLFTPDTEVRERYLDLFRERDIEKTYRLVLRGSPERRDIRIRSPLDGRQAETHLRLLRRHRGYALAECRIPTGRKHQIRKHLRQIDCTLAGDRRYNPSARVPRIEQDLPRQLLHAQRLAFTCPLTGKDLRLHAPLPRDFQQALQRLGLSGPKDRRG